MPPHAIVVHAASSAAQSRDPYDAACESDHSALGAEKCAPSALSAHTSRSPAVIESPRISSRRALGAGGINAPSLVKAATARPAPAPASHAVKRASTALISVSSADAPTKFARPADL